MSDDPRTDGTEVSVMGLRVHGLSAEDLHAIIGRAIQTRTQIIVGHHNLHSVYLAHHDKYMAAFSSRADWMFVDGMGVVALARLLGAPLRRRHRITYVDWIEMLCAEAALNGWRLFHLGGEPGVGARAASLLRARHPGLVLDSHSGYFDARPEAHENRDVLAQIAVAAPEILLVGMGMPRQERWVLQNADEIAATVILTCGACMDYVAGAQSTPPRWSGRLGLEWFFRLVADPRRLYRRYLIEPWYVARVALWGRLRGRPGSLDDR